MKLKKWLKNVDVIGLPCNIYIEPEDEPIYCGSMYNIPFWLVDMKIAKYANPEEKTKPISYAHGIRKSVNDEKGTKDYNGFIIVLKEDEDEDN